MYKNFSLGVKLSIFLIAAITVLISVSGFVTYWKFSDIVKKQTEDDLERIMFENKKNVEDIIDSINRATLYMCMDKVIADALNLQNVDQLERIAAINTLIRQMKSYLDMSLNDLLTQYNVSFFINPAMAFHNELYPGELPYSAAYGINVFSSDSVKNLSWYDHAYKLDGALFWFRNEADTGALFLGRAINNPYAVRPDNSNEEIGIAVVGFKLDEIAKKIQGLRLTEATHILLIDEEDNILFNTDSYTSMRSLRSYFTDLPADKGDGISVYAKAYDRKEYIVNSYLLKTGLILVAAVPLSDVLEPMKVVRNIILAITAASFLLGIILAIFISRRVSAPVRKLAHVMRDIEDESSIAVTIEPVSKDEVGFLYESFNKMMRRINFLVDDIYNKTQKQKEAEIKMLQAQINPHFLYNTLDSVNWMALSRGEDKIAMMLSSLASITRYSIKNANADVTVAEEMDHVSKYVNIQLVRYNNSFMVEYHLEPGILTCKMPKLLIQPLIENSIMHGFCKIHEAGVITVSGYQSGGDIRITVKDNGIGADARVLNAFLEGNECIHGRKSDSFGIRSVHQRIRLKYGENYGLKYNENNESGLIVEISLPVIKGENENFVHLNQKKYP